MNRARTVLTIVGTVMSGRTAVARIRQARDDGDRLELLDAALNVAVVLTGLFIIVRRMRRGEEEV
jgi:hypothetical protein